MLVNFEFELLLEGCINQQYNEKLTRPATHIMPNILSEVLDFLMEFVSSIMHQVCPGFNNNLPRIAVEHIK